MKLLDATLQYAIPTFGVAERWLKEELTAHGVTVRVTDAFVRDLAADADSAAREELSADDTAKPYSLRLHRELADRAEFVRAWTRSDDDVTLEHVHSDEWVRIARKHALPRAWKLSDPVAAPSRHPTPTYLYWARAS
jgi:hypothetical protein